jgi:two-component system NtrC family sensor kinase
MIDHRLYLDAISNSIHDGLVVIEKDYTISYANQAYARQVGLPLEEIIGRPCYRVSHNLEEACHSQGHECPVAVVLDTKRPKTVIHHHTDGKGSERLVEVAASPMLDERGEVVRSVEFIRDITERKRMERELLKADKLISLGVLSSGVSHEILNPLNNISMRLYLLQRDGLLESPQRTACMEMMAEVERITEVVGGLNAFSSQMLDKGQPMAVQEELGRALQHVNGQLVGCGIEVVEELLPKSPAVVGNPTLLHQAFVKILENAVEAMPEGGRLTLRTLEVTRNGLPMMDILISDTGVGIAPENQAKIFDPFFTTRSVGDGKGLGLSVALGVVRAHGGAVSVESSPGQGTTFTIELPLEGPQSVLAG